MYKKAAAFLAAVMLTLSAGCGNGEIKESGKNAESVSSDPKQSLALDPAEKPEPSKPAQPSKPDVQPEPAVPRQEKPTAVTPNEPLYRMSGTYRFKPIKEGTSEKVVLLTFDDGPKEKDMLLSMLDTLDKHRAKAIFFVNGYRIKANPKLLTLIQERGQTIGNHSWDHIDLRKESAAEAARQIGDVQNIVQKTIGEKPRFFRPPFGSGGDVVKEIARKEGLLFMTWSDGSLDWDKSTKNKPDLVIRNVMEQLHPGANILMHELPWTDQALDELLTKIEQKGYGFIDPATIEIQDAPSPAK
jgi:peptidoglycan/xylan/chitin deacetylase (PgdA/CDA1 family)